MLKNTLRKTGRWEDGSSQYQCLECYKKFYFEDYNEFFFCPGCGTKFKGCIPFKEKPMPPYEYEKVKWTIFYDGRKLTLSDRYNAKEALDRARSYSSEYGPTEIKCGSLSIKIDKRAEEYSRWHPICNAIGFKITNNNWHAASYWIRLNNGSEEWEYFDHYGQFRDWLMDYGTPEEIKIHNEMLPDNIIK